MRTGILIDELGVGFDAMTAQAREAAKLGYRTLWLAQRGGWDALTALPALGAAAPGIELGTCVVPTYPRHPITMAAQALTVQAATGVPVHLGVGLSHRYIVEHEFGYSYDRPIRHLREYLQALNPVLRGEKADVHGETLTAAGGVNAPGAGRPAVLVGSVSPRSTRLAGELADGVITTWAGPRAIGEFVVPALGTASRVVSGQLICVTSEVDERRAWVEETYGAAASVPAYRAVLDRDGYAKASDSAIIGDEETVRRQVKSLEDAGATELLVMPFGSAADQARTRELLAS
ncbi:TIGR03564 family F420-dependent LLM class oxidoreductase [Amycolatopsis sp. WQ 127309]|uniref:TIGR03564 family F420-dependent LLM class oxidoreductase n=1 Tax=Amycolatopsis sp. WQ 127309 TaxID=2932773 RepID=UPI001FF30EDA|nr:TIGR03564 family F420-dependent LLM class oxidoreductase [Amycolatopsis sp. WQ 127309]UOZ06146.1 TIGR03564 family F420-dependent LLM class oxidoreductase [Amycolatopsis sp. WQ 127309]